MISGTARNALRAVVYIAEREASGPVTAEVLSAELELPQNYLSKTLHRLVRDGVLDATRGRGGGYVLAIPAPQLPLDRVLDVIDPDSPARRCLLGRPECTDSDPCATHHRWCVVREAIDSFFAETTISDLFSSSPAGRGQQSLSSPEEGKSMSDPATRAPSEPPTGPGKDGPVPLMQRLYDSPFLLLAACIVVMFVFFTAWGMIEIMSLEPAPLP